MPRVFIGVGSNVEPEENVSKALRLLGRWMDIVAISNFYETEPQERPEQPAFINGVVEIETNMPPTELKHSVLSQIEDELGRIRTDDKYAERTIDLDILLYDELVIRDEGLNFPDPDIPRRAFLAVPLFELDPDLVLPDTGIPISQVVKSCSEHAMKPLKELTKNLRRETLDGHREG